MDKFYLIVLTIATVLLILILTYVGILMNKKTSVSRPFPPNSGNCPDYWEVSATDASLCIIPNNGGKNTGDIYNADGSNSLNASSTYGLTNDKSSVNFTVASWGATGSTSTCSKKKWANLHGLLWDGVSNYNSC